MRANQSLLLIAVVLLGKSWAMDVDTGKDAITLAKVIEAAGGRELGAGSWGFKGWVRLRGIATPLRGSEEQSAKNMAAVAESREALAELRAAGLHTCVMLRWKRNAESGVQRASSKYLPEDLREAYEDGRKLGAVYGNFVDAWEVGNEPDLGAVPEMAENYAAFLKATYLGLKAGVREARGQLSDAGYLLSGSRANNQQPATNNFNAPIVLMGALGLPPGPWLERFAANDGFAYTDGFNYHYYGYADDFSGVYRQFEAAVTELSGQNLQNGAGNFVHSVKKGLPIFLTEIGYGMLGKNARDTKEGRVRQWLWFKSVGQQASSLRIEAPMAFLLPPYLEYDTLEFGLTVAKVDRINKIDPQKDQLSFQSGGLRYEPADFGVKSAEPWMKMIGKEIGENEATPALAQWLAQRAKSQGQRSRSWTVNVPEASPVVIDFLAGEGLSPIKRYNGSFVTGKEPVAGLREDRGQTTEDGKKIESPKPKTEGSKPAAPSHSEEFMIHVRTANGNLYEVYPTRLATSEWQSYSEAQGNFTSSFYGRAELPWRFKDNRPASLVVVMYPKSLPVTYEFRRVRLLKLGAGSPDQGAGFRYGRGTVVLYNFSDKEVSGRITLPTGVERVDPNARTAESVDSASSVLKLLPGERREISVMIKVPWERFERIEAPITFVPEGQTIPAAQFVTSFIPDIGGMQTTVVAELLQQRTETSNKQPTADNRSFIANRPRATEEAPMTEQQSFFAQRGVKVERTSDGFTVTVTGTPPGKQQRVEVEVPWPDGLAFTENKFLNLEYRLKVERVDPNALASGKYQTTR